jgi:hypothetical protein
MRYITVAVVLLAAACATTHAATHEWWQGSITVQNDSNYAVHHLYLTPAHETHWGPDQLGHDVLESNETVMLAGLECEDYDLKLVDHEGDECVVEDINLCLQDAHWQITDHELANCAGFAK